MAVQQVDKVQDEEQVVGYYQQQQLLDPNNL